MSLRVSIIGAGIFGLSCAYECAKAGHKVTIFDRFEPGHGASGGVVGAMSPHAPDQWNEKKNFQFEALVSASQFWSEIEALTGLSSGYARNGRYSLIPSEKARDLALRRQESSSHHWGANWDWDVQDQCGALVDAYNEHGVIFDTLSAQIYPRLAIAALQKAVLDLGVDCQWNAPIQDLAEFKNGSDQSAKLSDVTILAAGSEAFALLKPQCPTDIGSGEKGQAALLEGSLSTKAMIQGEGLYIINHEGHGIAIGSTSEKSYSDGTSTDYLLDELIEKAMGICPELRGRRSLAKWAGIRPKAIRRNPLIDIHPDHPDLYLACGGYKIGFGIAHHCARLIARSISGENMEFPHSFSYAYHIK